MLCALHVEVVAAVEGAVADGFHDVGVADGNASLEVGNGTGHFKPESVIRICVRTDFILSKL